MLKSIFTAIFAICLMIAGDARCQVYSPEKISVNFPKASRTPVQFIECRNGICSFQSNNPLAAVLFMVDGDAQNIGMLSVTFHSSKARTDNALIREALKFAQYPEANDIDATSLMKTATPSGMDVEIEKGLGARLINLTSVDKNVFCFRFYRMGD